jgi:hypothetical protein
MCVYCTLIRLTPPLLTLSLPSCSRYSATYSALCYTVFTHRCVFQYYSLCHPLFLSHVPSNRGLSLSLFLDTHTHTHTHALFFFFLGGERSFSYLHWPQTRILLPIPPHWHVPYAQLTRWDGGGGGVSVTFCQGWPQAVILPISPSPVASITCTHHHTQPQL